MITIEHILFGGPVLVVMLCVVGVTIRIFLPAKPIKPNADAPEMPLNVDVKSNGNDDATAINAIVADFTDTCFAAHYFDKRGGDKASVRKLYLDFVNKIAPEQPTA